MGELRETEFGQIAADWKFIPSTEFCSKVTDGTHDSPKEQKTGKHLITSKHIKGKDVDFESAYLISDEDFRKINERSKVDQWDVIISMIGEYCGFSFVERNEIINYAVKNVGLFKTGDQHKAYWLYYFLNSKIGRFILETNKSGTSQPYLTLGFLRNLPIIYPSSDAEAKSIVDILLSLDDKIELLHRQNKTLEQLAKTLFRQWFVEEANSTEEIILGDYVDCINGFSYKSSELNPSDVALVTLKSFNRDGGFRLDGFKEFTGKIKEHQIVREGDLVVAHTDITQEAEVIGNPVLIIEDPKYKTLVITMDLVKVVPKEKNYSIPFLYHLMRTPEFKFHCLGCANGTTVLHLSKSAIPTFTFPKPDFEKVKLFTVEAGKLTKKFLMNHNQIRTLTQLRDTLLPKLMSGEVRVKWDEKSSTELKIDTKPIYTIGHSNHSIDKFIKLLTLNHINVVVDVRSTPFSRYNPQFNRENLIQSLKQINIKYLFMGKELGGRPKDLGDYDEGVADYDRISNQNDFKNGIERLLRGKKDFNIAIMCSEKDPLNCHRMLLVGRALKKFKVPIKHILAGGEIEDNSIAEKRLLDVTGLKPTLFDANLDEKQRLDEAYKKRSLEVAFKLPNVEEE